MARVIPLSWHPRHRWHPTRGDQPPQRETSTSHEVAELRAEVAQLRAELVDLRIACNPLPASWGGPVVRTGDGEELTEERARELLALAEAEDDARLKEGA